MEFSKKCCTAATLLCLLLVGNTGCRVVPSCQTDPISLVPPVEKSSLDPQPVSELTPIKIPFIDPVEKGLIPGQLEEAYPLTLRQCEWLAAKHAPLAKVLEIETATDEACQSCDDVDPCVRDLANSALLANSAYQRNLAAEQALSAYLGLVEVYLQNQLVEETVDEIVELQTVLKQLQDDGILKTVDPEILVRKKLDAISKRNDLLFNYEKLNENLRTLLGLADQIHPIWTDCQIEQWQLPKDLNAEIEMAEQNRADLQALSTLANTSNEQLLDTLRSSVRSFSPLAGLVLQNRLFGGYFSDQSAEMNRLRAQLHVLQNAQSDLVKSKVTENYYAIYRDYEQIQVNLQRLESLKKSETRLEALREVAPVKVEEVLSIKSDILKARSEIIHSAIELQRAWIKLKAAQGLLGRT